MASPPPTPIAHASAPGAGAPELALQQAVRRSRGWWHAGAWTALDAVAGIGFAAGLAGAVAALAHAGLRDAPAWLALIAASALARALMARQASGAGLRAAQFLKRLWRGRIVAAALRRGGGAVGGVAVAGSPLGQGWAGLAVEEIEALGPYVERFLPARQAAVWAPLVVLVATACASPVTAAILAATLIPFVVLMALAGRASASESQRQFEALGRLSGLLADRVRALPVVLALRGAARERRQLAAAADDVARRTLRVLRLAFISSAVLEFFAALSVAMVAVYCGFGLLGLLPFPAPERFELGRAFFVLALAPEFYLPMRRLAAAYHDRQAAWTAAERLLAFEAEAALPPASVAPSSRNAPPRVRFDSVALAHGAGPLVLRGLDVDLPAGGVLALRGRSGSGKTTVLRALLGLARLREGAIRIDGQPMPDAGHRAEHVAWIGQQPLIVPGTLRHNLLLAAPEATPQQIDDAIKRAGLQHLLAQRRGGLDAGIDARGGGLSGGERRRLALARALLKNAPLWLLDEPTAHLDASAEAALIDTLRSACAGRTVLIATHSERLAAMADRTVDLDELAAFDAAATA